MVEQGKSLLLEIFILSTISILTVIIFSHIQTETKNETMALLSYNSTLEIEEVDSGNILLMPIHQKMITDESSAKYQVQNKGEDTSYQFILVISKDSTYDKNYLCFKVNDYYGKLNEVEWKEDNENYYYYLKEDLLEKNHQEDIYFNIWLDTSYQDDIMNQYFSYYIIVSNTI